MVQWQLIGFILLIHVALFILLWSPNIMDYILWVEDSSLESQLMGISWVQSWGSPLGAPGTYMENPTIALSPEIMLFYVYRQEHRILKLRNALGAPKIVQILLGMDSDDVASLLLISICFISVRYFTARRNYTCLSRTSNTLKVMLGSKIFSCDFG